MVVDCLLLLGHRYLRRASEREGKSGALASWRDLAEGSETCGRVRGWGVIVD